MNTIRINQVLYNDAVVYARKHNMSVDSLVEILLFPFWVIVNLPIVIAQ